MKAPANCELCARAMKLTKHHLIPRTRHKNKKNKKDFDRKEIHERVAWICRPCHSNVHASYSEKELEREWNTLEALREAPLVQKFVQWIKNKPPETRVATRKANRRR